MALPASLGLERKNPLPVGRYWVFRTGLVDIEAFDKWLATHRKMQVLKVVASDFDPGGPFLNTHPPTAFVVFQVLAPNAVVWQGPGLPDRAPPHVTNRQDVEQAPIILDSAERLENAAQRAASAVTRGGETFTLLLFAAAVLYLLSQKGSHHAMHR